MKYSKELKEQIAQEIKEVGNVTAVAKKHGIASSTIHGWIYHQKIKAGSVKEVRQELSLKNEYFEENKRLKKQLEKKDLEISIMKDLLKKTYQIFPGDEKLL